MPANETSLTSNTSLVNFTSDYQYVLGATQGRLLEAAGMFRSMHFADQYIDQIRYDLEDTAKMFAEQQGLAPGAPSWRTEWDGSRKPNTGTLYNGIKAIRTGQTIRLRSEARDSFGRYYGGHVEFGHGSVPARPHLRPALYAVSQASQGKLRSALHNLFTGAFNGDMSLAFGTGGGLSASYYANQGGGSVRSYMSRGTRAQQMKYHFGSIRNYNPQKGVSRKASTFRQSMSSTAKKSMGWGRQKSLNPSQRVRYSRTHPYNAARIRNMKGKTWQRFKTSNQNAKRVSTSRQHTRLKKLSGYRKTNERNRNARIRQQTKSKTFMAEQRLKSSSSAQQYRQNVAQANARKAAERQTTNDFMRTDEGRAWGIKSTGYHGNSYFNSYKVSKSSSKSKKKSDWTITLAGREY